MKRGRAARSRVALAMGLLALLTTSCQAPTELAAPTEAKLVHWVLEGRMAARRDFIEPVVCLEVKTTLDEANRDARPEETPDGASFGVLVTGASACVKDRDGAYHQESGEQAIVIGVGVMSLSEDGHGVYTVGWYRGGLNAGSSKCEATWNGQAWVQGECTPQWTA